MAFQSKAQTIDMPPPATTGGTSLNEALATRRSVRSYKSEPLDDADISQLLWSAQGVTNAKGYRAAPSAGAKFPLEIYLVKASGSYHYLPQGHRLERLGSTDLRSHLEHGDAPAIFVMAADYGKTEEKYGSRAERYVKLEAGHACQNLLLQATTLGLGGVSIGSFDDDEVADLMNLPYSEEVLYIVPVGQPDE